MLDTFTFVQYKLQEMKSVVITLCDVKSITRSSFARQSLIVIFKVTIRSRNGEIKSLCTLLIWNYRKSEDYLQYKVTLWDIKLHLLESKMQCGWYVKSHFGIWSHNYEKLFNFESCNFKKLQFEDKVALWDLKWQLQESKTQLRYVTL